MPQTDERKDNTQVRATKRIWAGTLAASIAATSWFGVSPASAGTTKDLIFSEYVEGSSNNKYIELFNGTGADLDLSQYTVELYANGRTTVTNKATLAGTLADQKTHVLKNAQATRYAGEATSSPVANFNGDDIIVLKKGDVVVDSIGQLGSTDKFGVDVTLVRKPTVTVGDADPSDAFDPAAQWDTYAKDDVSHLGNHTLDGTPAEPGPTDPADPTLECKADATRIGAVQGESDTAAMSGKTVTVQGAVVGDFRTGGFNGYFIQDTGDGNDATSDGLFIYDRNGVSGELKVGDTLRVTGQVSEFKGMTQLSPKSAVNCGAGELPAPTVIDFPNTDYERHEGMLVTYAKPLTVLEVYNFGRFGEIAVGPEQQYQPTALHAPESEEAQKLYESNRRNRITIDDGRGAQNPTPAINPATLEPMTMDNLFSVGDEISGLVGVMDYRFNLWRIQPTKAGTVADMMPRPEIPTVDGNLKVASANVLNYFTTLTSEDPDARGAATKEEFERQQAKIVASLNKLDAAIVGLNEIENNGTAVEALVAALNKDARSQKWAALKTGRIGTDAITTALIYQPALVEPVGGFDTLTSADDPRFIDKKNRPTLAQTFKHLASGETLTVAVNHLKSKGSACGDPSEATMNHLVGNCQETRVAAVEALTDWLGGGKIGVEKSENVLVIGDMNSYDHEKPIKVFEQKGYTDMVKHFHGDKAFSYVFDGQLGYLDYALANQALMAKVTGAADWHTNSTELPLIDYSMKYKQPAEAKLFAPDAFRSSDHDPVLIGIQLGEAPAECSISANTAGNKLVGDRTNLWGTVTGCAGDDVTVEVRKGGKWAEVSTAKLGADGSFVAPLDSLATRGTYEIRVRVGDEVSETTTLTRIARTQVSRAPYKLVGDDTLAWGSVDGAAKVISQVYIAGRGWQPSQMRDAKGYFTIPLTYGKTARGAYQYRFVIQHEGGPVEVTPSMTQMRVARTTATVAPTKRVGEIGNVWGSVDGGATVMTQIKLADRGWQPSQVREVNGFYAVPLTYGVNTPGAYEWRLVIKHYNGLIEVTPTMTQRRVS